MPITNKWDLLHPQRHKVLIRNVEKNKWGKAKRPLLKRFNLQGKHIQEWFIPQKRINLILKSWFPIIVVRLCCWNNFPILPDTPVAMVIYVWVWTPRSCLWNRLSYGYQNLPLNCLVAITAFSKTVVSKVIPWPDFGLPLFSVVMITGDFLDFQGKLYFGRKVATLTRTPHPERLFHQHTRRMDH